MEDEATDETIRAKLLIRRLREEIEKEMTHAERAATSIDETTYHYAAEALGRAVRIARETLLGDSGGEELTDDEIERLLWSRINAIAESTEALTDEPDGVGHASEEYRGGGGGGAVHIGFPEHVLEEFDRAAQSIVGPDIRPPRGAGRRAVRPCIQLARANREKRDFQAHLRDILSGTRTPPTKTAGARAIEGAKVLVGNKSPLSVTLHWLNIASHRRLSQQSCERLAAGVICLHELTGENLHIHWTGTYFPDSGKELARKCLGSREEAADAVGSIVEHYAKAADGSLLEALASHAPEEKQPKSLAEWAIIGAVEMHKDYDSALAKLLMELADVAENGLRRENCIRVAAAVIVHGNLDRGAVTQASNRLCADTSDDTDLAVLALQSTRSARDCLSVLCAWYRQGGHGEILEALAEHAP